MQKKISKKWKIVSKSVFGCDTGGCHWCQHIKNKGGYATCNHEDSQYYKARIRSWDCAISQGCSLYQVQDWYTSDKNHTKTFS